MGGRSDFKLRLVFSGEKNALCKLFRNNLNMTPSGRQGGNPSSRRWAVWAGEAVIAQEQLHEDRLKGLLPNIKRNLPKRRRWVAHRNTGDDHDGASIPSCRWV